MQLVLVAFEVDGHDQARNKTSAKLSAIAPQNASMCWFAGNKKPEADIRLGLEV
jgi:hypothetical protein